MKVLYIALFLLSSLACYADSPQLGILVSSVEQPATGYASISVRLLANQRLKPIAIAAPIGTSGWGVSTQTNFSTIEPMDSGQYLDLVVNLAYPIANLPFFPVDFKLRCSYTFNGRDTLTAQVPVFLYFTPYNTIEIFNDWDFSNLGRGWIARSNLPGDTSRISIAKSAIPKAK